jgi:hypothetical protein
VTDQSVPKEYLDWLDSIRPREGIGGNEAWNAGVAWERNRRATPAEGQVLETVDLYGVGPDGEKRLGKVAMPPRMKARELVTEMFGAIDDDSGNDASMAFAVCDQLLDWMKKQRAAIERSDKGSDAGGKE